MPFSANHQSGEEQSSKPPVLQFYGPPVPPAPLTAEKEKSIQDAEKFLEEQKRVGGYMGEQGLWSILRAKCAAVRTKEDQQEASRLAMIHFTFYPFRRTHPLSWDPNRAEDTQSGGLPTEQGDEPKMSHSEDNHACEPLVMVWIDGDQAREPSETR
ncbi:hypothetical protein BKA93DRAFT_748332 [Sparassis latifolia]|uniref:Uncharacterized protein n=1 Tax=Sparassis crispa TaxID=139825 RepID=A0A401H2U4_9APHY|nr:hypothetical protein SCP_1400850 [Sparassis crispa]GBE88680.1 hypothetical protein SCP_1400850 [Sparassis crispa]